MVHGKASDDGDVDQLQKQVNCLAAGLTQVEKDVAALTSLLTNHFSHQTSQQARVRAGPRCLQVQIKNFRHTEPTAAWA